MSRAKAEPSADQNGEQPAARRPNRLKQRSRCKEGPHGSIPPNKQGLPRETRIHAQRGLSAKPGVSGWINNNAPRAWRTIGESCGRPAAGRKTRSPESQAASGLLKYSNQASIHPCPTSRQRRTASRPSGPSRSPADPEAGSAGWPGQMRWPRCCRPGARQPQPPSPPQHKQGQPTKSLSSSQCTFREARLSGKTGLPLGRT